MKVEEITKCRVCGNDSFKLLYDLGDMYVSGFIEVGGKAQKAPIVVIECDTCGLVQLNHTADLDVLYKEQYWYKSSLNKSMIESLQDIVEKTLKKVRLESGDIVVDIGCNDGTLFKFYPKNVFKIGYEPASNVKEDAEKYCDMLISDYFSAASYKYDKAKIVTSIAMFYDLPDPGKFIDDVFEILDDNGMWVIQLTDLTTMLKLTEFTSFCHEHLEYYTLDYLVNLLGEHKFTVTDIEYNKTNGGSLRLYCEKYFPFGGYTTKIVKALAEETKYLAEHPFSEFKSRVENAKKAVTKYLEVLNNNGEEVYALGASTKGATLCQYFGIDNSMIKAIGEVNPDKYGLITAGTNIPIISEDELLSKNPKYILLIIWQFKDNIIKKLEPYIKDGLTVIVPLPKPVMITSDGEFELVNFDIRVKTIGFLIDQLITTDLRCWFAQEDIMNEDLDDTLRLEAAVRAQRQNAIRSELIRAIDEYFGEANTSLGVRKSYYTYFGDKNA